MKKLAIIPILFLCFTSCVSRVVDWHHITIPSFVYDYRELNEEIGWQFNHNELRLEYVTPWESRKVVATLGLIKEKYATPESREAHRKLSNKRIFPAVDIPASSTRRDDLLLPTEVLSRITSTLS